MRDYILLFVNGVEHRVTNADAFLTLSDYLRLRLKLCGTKIVCSEGDCGSCSVLCGSLTNDPASYLPIDSCIRFLFQLDGCHIVTVEGLSRDGEISPVQQAMVDCHGSQCGFCTPGFVVAMTGILQQNSSPDESAWRCGLTGNLCRCTGYSPILSAGKAATANPGPRLNEIYPPGSIGRNADSEQAIQIESGGNIVSCPTTIEQAVEFLDAHPDCTIVAGATDIGVRFNKGDRGARRWLDLNRVDTLEQMRLENGVLHAGARTTWTALEQITADVAPEFHEIITIFGSPQIRHVGTIGGNIINASPIADSIPFLSVCDAELKMTGKDGSRTVGINEFYTGYKQFDLRPGELLTGIRIPLPEPDQKIKLYKVSRRRDLDISTFTAAINMRLDGNEIRSAAIAYGAVGPVVLRLNRTEEFLTGKALTMQLMQQAGEIAVSEITPITDVRGGAGFRFQLAGNVLIKFFHEVQPQGVTA